MTSTHEFSDASPSSVAEAKALVEKIQDHIETKRDETPEEEAAKLRRLQNRILESLDDAAHVVPELVQNVDDVGDGCTEATIRHRDNELMVENDGEGMSEAEVKALGEFAESTKHDLSQIGHFGIGFKTVFSVTERPHVDSGYVSLEYSEDEPEIPRSAFEKVDSGFEGTRVRLPLSENLSDTRIDEIRSQLDAINRLLPFLNNLQTITVERDGETTTYERVDESAEDDGRVTVHKYENKDDDTPCETWHYRLFTESLNADSETAEALAEERDLDLGALEDRDVDIKIELAFPVSEHGYPIEHEDSRLFCYFPASRETNLPFDVQADFLLKSSREQIRPGHPINDKLLQVAGSLVEDAIQTFQAEAVPPSRLLTLIPDAGADRPDYLTPLTDETFDALSGLEFVPVESGGTRAPKDLLVLPSQLHDVIPLAEFCAEYEAVNAAHPTQELTADDYDRLAALDSTRVLSVAETLEEMSDMGFVSAFGTTDVVDLLATVEEYLDSIYSHNSEYDPTVEALKSLPVYPIRGDDQDRQSLNTIDDDIYRPARQGEGTYEPFYDDLTLLGDALLSALRSGDVSEQTRADIRNLFSERLDVEEIKHKDIVEKVVAEAFATTKENDDETLDEYIEYLRDHAQSHADASNTKVRTEAGDYKSPDELYLPKQYLEGRYDSSLVLGTLTDRDPVSMSYLERNPKAEDTEAWRNFFASLGALTHLPVSPDVDYPTRETFQSQDEIVAYLDEHDDEGTRVRPDRDTDPYDGRNGQYRWMKRADAQHGLVDYALPGDVEDSFEDAAETTAGFGREFVKMLDAYWETTDTDQVTSDHDWDGTYQNSMFRDYCWSVPSNGYDVNTEASECPTSFLALLRKTAWLPGRGEERYQPSHLYEPNPITERAGVPRLPKKVASLSSGLLDSLNVSDDVGLEQYANGIEQIIAERSERDSDQIDREIRSHLHSLANRVDEASEDEIADLTEQLADCPFIYIPGASPEFRNTDQVAWSAGLGDHVVPIADHYRGFESLFIDVMEVDVEPTLETYVSYLGHAEADDWQTVEDAWKEVVKQAGHQAPANHDLDEVAAMLSESGAVPSAAETIVSYDEIQYVAHNIGAVDRLPEKIAQQVALPCYDNRFDRSEAVKRLTTLLDASRLEEELEQVVTAPDYEATETTLYECFSQPLDVGYSLLIAREATKAQERLRDIASYTVQGAKTVMCDYRLGADSIAVDEHVYVDEANEHVYVAETDAARLDLADALATALGLDSNRNKFVELVEGAVGKSRSLVDMYIGSHDLPREYILSESYTSKEKSLDRCDGSSDPDDNPKTDRSNGSGITSTKETDGIGESTKPDSAGTEDRDMSESVEKRSNDIVGDSGMEDSTDPSGSTRLSPKILQDADASLLTDVGTGGTTDYNGGGWSRLNGGGSGTDDTGDAGEQFVLDYLRDLFETQLDDIELTKLTDTTLSDAYRVSGQYDGQVVTVTVGKVPDHDEPHSDLLIDGALLIREDDEFAVDRVADDERTLVEVKSTEKNSSELKLTPAEQREAQRTPEYLIARPVDVGSDSERLETVFDTIPTVHINPDASGRLEIKDIQYEGMWLSY